MKQLFAVVALAVLLAACGSPAPSTDAPASGQPVASSEPTVSSNIADLFRLGTSSKCTATTSEGSATIYISGAKQRMDATSNGESVHSIVDSSYVYVWTDRENKGFKMSKRTIEDTANEAASQYQGQTPESFAETPDAQVSCSAWLADSSKFTPPSSVEFEDFDAMMQQVQQMQQSGQIPSDFNPDDYN